MIFGPLMFVALVALLWADDALGRVDLRGTVVQTLMCGREFLPPGLILLGFFIGLIWSGSREIARIAAAKNLPVDRRIVILGPIAVVVVVYLTPPELTARMGAAQLGTVFALGLLATLVRHTRGQRTEGAVAAGATTLFAMVYMGLLGSFYVLIRHHHSAWVVASLMMVAKSCDIGAYFTGRMFGRHKLIFWLSPGKTWEGFFGGVLLAGLVAVAVVGVVDQYTGIFYDVWVDGHFLRGHYHVPLWYVLICGCILGAVGQFGDLVASLFKRDAQLKDSGTSIPGFGGILDVVDSPIVVAPLAYWMVLLAQELFGILDTLALS
jgi:phosphatidate cytidylyltransferase